MSEIVRFTIENRQLASQAFAIRTTVFVEEQQVDPVLEMDAYDDIAIHYLLTENGKALATARRRDTPKGIKLERFAVLPAHRNKGLGARILDAVMQDIGPVSCMIYLHSQESAVNFYKRHGFHIVGDAFVEAGIVHYLMVLKAEDPRFF